MRFTHIRRVGYAFCEKLLHIYLPLQGLEDERNGTMAALKTFLEQHYRTGGRSSLREQRFRQIAHGRAEKGLTGESHTGTMRLLQLGAEWG
jgi:hypothetical protein